LQIKIREKVDGKCDECGSKKFTGWDYEVYEHMKEHVPTGKPQRDLRFVNAGKIYTSGGI
jgi:hypothetical protein